MLHDKCALTMHTTVLSLHWGSPGLNSSADHPVESPQFPWRSLFIAETFSDVSVSHPSPSSHLNVHNAGTTPSNLCQVPCNASLCCPPMTLCLRCLAESNRRVGAGERPVFDVTLALVLASFTPSGGLIQILLCGQQTHTSPTHHFLFLCICEQSSGFPGGPRGEEPACRCRRQKRHGFDPWVGKVPWRRAWQPTPVCLPGESHGQRSLVGHSPQGRTESDTTEVT